MHGHNHEFTIDRPLAVLEIENRGSGIKARDVAVCERVMSWAGVVAKSGRALARRIVRPTA